MVTLEDGTGRGFKAGVDSEHSLQVYAISVTAEHHTNHEHGQAYNAQFDQSPTANDDCIFYMENSHPTQDLIIEGFTLQMDGAGEIYFQLNNEGTRNGATVITPTNLNASSGNDARGTFEQGVDLDGGAATLTGGTEFERYVFNAANNSQNFNFECDVILGLGNTLTVWCSSSARTVTGTAVFFYHAPVD